MSNWRRKNQGYIKFFSIDGNELIEEEDAPNTDLFLKEIKFFNSNGGIENLLIPVQKKDTYEKCYYDKVCEELVNEEILREMMDPLLEDDDSTMNIDYLKLKCQIKSDNEHYNPFKNKTKTFMREVWNESESFSDGRQYIDVEKVEKLFEKYYIKFKIDSLFEEYFKGKKND